MTVQILPDAAAQFDASQPSDSVVWPEPHDPKIDVATIIENGLVAVGITDVPVLKDGSFHTSELRFQDAAGNEVSRPVITISRGGDQEERVAIGDHIGVYAKGDPSLVDEDEVVLDGDNAVIQGRLSNVTIDVTISDLNGYRADQMYLIVKLIMLAAKQEFRRIGYIDVRRINGQDLQKIEINDPEPGIVFSRTLTYACKHPDFVAGLATLVALVKQSLTVTPGPTSQIITSDL